jgi:hypothetical protein
MTVVYAACFLSQDPHAYKYVEAGENSVQQQLKDLEGNPAHQLLQHLTASQHIIIIC